MWASKGRSGYGDSTIGGDYDSWNGVSPNGRQYRNEVTMETRDLSGADYWHLRKQNRPTEQIPASLHMLNKDRANIDAYADKEPVKKSRVPLKNKVFPQLTRYNNLTEQMKEIVAQYHAKEIDINEYTLLMDATVAKRDRTEVLLKQAMQKKPVRNTEEDEDAQSDTRQANASFQPEFVQEKGQNSVKNSVGKACNSALKDAIVFLSWSAVLLIGFKLFF